MVAVLDFGSQYSQLIARRVRSLGVTTELLPYTTPPSQLRQARAIILSGGPNSVYAPKAPHLDRRVFSLGVPVLGICYCMQLMAHHLGGRVVRAPKGEYGPAVLQIRRSTGLFKKIKPTTPVWMSHGDVVAKLPPGFVRLAWTDNSRDAAIAA